MHMPPHKLCGLDQMCVCWRWWGMVWRRVEAKLAESG